MILLVNGLMSHTGKRQCACVNGTQLRVLERALLSPCRFETTKNVAYMVLIHNTADMYLVRRVLFLKMWEKVSVSGLHWTEGVGVGLLKSL